MFITLRVSLPSMDLVSIMDNNKKSYCAQKEKKALL